MIYLDNAATSYPKPEAVYQAVDDYMRHVGVSPGRGGYRRAFAAEQILFATRQALGRLLGIAEVERIVFTTNATESLNLALKGLLRPGDHVVTSHFEHNSMWRVLKTLERDQAVELSVVPGNGCTPLDLDCLRAALRKTTRLVAITHASNVTGSILPIKDVGTICADAGVPLLVDAAQTAGVHPIDADGSNIGMLAFTGHKGLLGPMGTGGLYLAPSISLRPLKEGGTGSDSLLAYQPDHLPDRYEAGTLNVAGIAGLRAGLGYILERGVGDIQSQEEALTVDALQRLQDVPALTLYGPSSAVNRVAVVSVNIGDMDCGEVAYKLDRDYQIMVRSGLHCSPQAHHAIGTLSRGAVRVSFGCFNTHNDVDRLCHAVREIAAAKGV